ncbi:MAG: penicillin acylase family protein [Burkholderiales bacterium]|nr:penicillin acylase family protein [Burkholderiales bacterium]
MRWLIRGLLAVVVVLAAGAIWLLSGHARGPNVSGTVAFNGLSAPVQVLRDGHGIPYIFAQNTPDLIRAQGFVTAQSRIFQLEAYRAIASGRLAEAIGEKGLKNDREIRLIGLRRNAERHAKLLSPAARQWLGWYAEGMNAYITQHADDLPVELKLAGFRASEWQIADMVNVLHFVNWSQAANYKAELLTQLLIDKLGYERASDLFPPAYRDAPTGIPRPAAASPAPTNPSAATKTAAMWLGVGDPSTASLASDDAFRPPLAVGSNNWVVAGSRAANGKPMVVNDPHLDARVLPGIWMPVGLFSPDIRAVGAALPAVPGILVGRNADVAFGVTNAYGDSQDLFIEQLAPGKPDHYLDGDQAKPFAVSNEVIRIKDKDAPGGYREETLSIKRTVRGPVVSAAPLGANKDRVLSLRMVSAELPGGEIGIDRMLLAKNADELNAAVQQIDVMYFNFVFADKAGAIGHRATGRVPVRRSGQGLYPKPAAREDDWLAMIPPDKMPGQRSPARGWIGTANHDTRAADTTYEYSSFFSPAYRIERIGEVLDAAKATTVADHARLQMDIRNKQARHLLPLLVTLFKGVPGFEDWAAILSAWDGDERADQPASLIYRHLYQRIAYETFVDELGDEAARKWLAQGYLWQARFDQLLQLPNSAWFDDVRTPARESLTEIAHRAATAVRAELIAKYGADAKAWKWGAEHVIHFDAPLRRTGAGRDFLGRAAQPYDGSNETVMRALTLGFMSGYDVDIHASMRIVADLADDEKVQAVLSGGVVERQFHAHQKDQLDAWFAGKLLPWWFDQKAIEREARSRQTLAPVAK